MLLLPARSRILRILTVVFVFFGSLVLSASVRAQDKVEIFGGYSYLRPPVQLQEFLPAPCPTSGCGPFFIQPSVNLNGWEFSGAYHLFPALSAVADFSGHYGSTHGESVHLQTYLFGPQISLPARVSPFAHLLFGGAHESISNNSCCTLGNNGSSFALAIGAGIDAKIAPFLSWRIFQADYLRTRFNGGAQNQARASTGIVFHF
jgi:hypothetical protein